MITAISHEFRLNCFSWTMDYHSIITWTPPEWMTHVRLRIHHNIVTWSPEWMAHFGLWIDHSIFIKTHPKWPMLHYGIVKAFSRKPLLKSSCWTTESSQHSRVNFPWIAHVELWINTTLSGELSLDCSRSTTESSEHSHVKSSWMTYVALRNHHSVLT
jgi:hypothetical protein